MHLDVLRLWAEYGIMYVKWRGAVVQLGEHHTGSVDVRGSSPLSSTTSHILSPHRTAHVTCRIIPSFCFPIPHLRARPGRSALVCALVLIALPSWGEKLGASMGPDVLVLVRSGFSYRDTISISYSGSVPDAQVRKDIQSLIKTGRWAVSRAQVSTEGTNTPGSKASTSVTFETDPIVSPPLGLYPLEPFLVALKRFHTIQVIYLLREHIDFRGLRDYDNDNVSIRYQSPATYTVNMKHHDFDRLNLPLTQPKKPAVAHKSDGSGMTGLIVILAVLCGIIAYCVAALYSKSHRNTSGEKHK
jgi:hypothetical protein